MHLLLGFMDLLDFSKFYIMQPKEDSGEFIAINFSLVNEASNAITSGLINDDTSAIPLLSSDESFVLTNIVFVKT